MREFAGEFCEQDEGCDRGQKTRADRSRIPAHWRTRLMKRVKVEEERSHLECPRLVVPSDIHTASNQCNGIAQSKCPGMNSGAAAFQNHQEDLIDDEGFIWCAGCGDWFKDRCPTCDSFQPDSKSYCQADDLEKEHAEEKPCQCVICGKSFRFPSFAGDA